MVTLTIYFCCDLYLSTLLLEMNEYEITQSKFFFFFFFLEYIYNVNISAEVTR